MKLTRANFECLIIPGKIFYFSNSELGTVEPHYYICITCLPDNTILSCCTSQFDTVRRLIEKGKFPHTTLVTFYAKDQNNPFKKDTYISCNEYFPYTVDELWNLYDAGLLTIKGDLPIYSFQELVIGFLDSDMIEDDIKDNLPDPDTLG